MKNSNGLKRVLFVLGLSCVLVLLAGQALAAAYAPGAGAAGITSAGQSGAVMMGNTTANQVWQENTAGQTTNGNAIYRMMPAQTLTSTAITPYALNRQGVWYGLMFIITIILVWTVLIQLIFVLHHWLKKHKHS